MIPKCHSKQRNQYQFFSMCLQVSILQLMYYYVPLLYNRISASILTRFITTFWQFSVHVDIHVYQKYQKLTMLFYVYIYSLHFLLLSLLESYECLLQTKIIQVPGDFFLLFYFQFTRLASYI